jgi:hypothetical protein
LRDYLRGFPPRYQRQRKLSRASEAQLSKPDKIRIFCYKYEHCKEYRVSHGLVLI